LRALTGIELPDHEGSAPLSVAFRQAVRRCSCRLQQEQQREEGGVESKQRLYPKVLEPP
jgi:hypothetical protein